MIILFNKRNVKVIFLLFLVLAMLFAFTRGLHTADEVVRQEAAAVWAQQDSAKFAKKIDLSLQEDLPKITAPPVASAATSAQVAASPDTSSSQVEPTEEKAAISVLSLKMQRSQNRSQTQEKLENILANANISTETKAEAEADLLRLAQINATELACETLLQTKGYTNAVVLIDTDSAAVYVTDKLADGDYAKIGDLVQQSTDFALEQIVIIPTIE